MHCCKLNEHDRHICPEAVIPCVNANYGCTELLKRRCIASHIEHCPASTVFCSFSYERSEKPSIKSVESKSTGATHVQANEGEEGACKAPLLDEKFLCSDLNVQEKTNLDVSSESDMDKDVVSLYAGSYLKQYHSSGFEETTGLSSNLSMDINIGILTNYVSGAAGKLKAKLLEIQKQRRTCIDTTVNTKLHFLENGQKSKKCCTFLCNSVVRRDEFAAHWKSLHVDIQLEIESLIERCPMRAYGCKFGIVNLVPNPGGSTLDYSPETDCFLYKAPPVELTNADDTQVLDSRYTARIQAKQELAMYGYEDDEESYDVLGQLPTEVLMAVCGFLDSQSLWHLSQVNHYMRKVCLGLVKKSGMVYSDWVRDGSGRWTLGPKVHTCVYGKNPT